ncbi:hypothetical protein ACQPWR_16875 [Micromonospora vinacea]|uniref:hypothetical protein n=1 Tax=Micromonospora vinacea TaxID=709878 RepID=UPI003D8A5646
MPPRRRPRSWLARRLRSAAGAVQRLAGRVEPAGHRPTPSQTPEPTPRRFGEPPQHWLDLVAAHAPGLLHDLDLDPSAIGNAEAGTAGPGGSTGRVDAAGADPVANAGSGRLGGSGRFARLGRSGREPDVGGPGASGDKGPTTSRAGTWSGWSGRPSRVGDQPDGTGTGAAGPSDGGAPSSSSDVATPPAGSTWPDASTPPSGSTWPAGPDAAEPPVREAAGRSATAIDASGSPRADGPRQPVRSMVFGRHGSPSSRPHPVETEATRTTPHPPLDALWPGGVDQGPSPDSSPVRPAADRLSADRDGFRSDSADGQAQPTKDQREHTRRVAGSPNRAFPVHRAASGRPGWPIPGGIDAPWTDSTTTSVGNQSTSGRGDLARVVNGSPWLTLPGEPAPPGRTAALGDTGTGAVNGGRSPDLDGPPLDVVVTSLDRWPALPDDTALWSVAGAAVDTAQLTRLDREQAGD